MKEELIKIMDETLRSFDEIEDIPEAADKILNLFNKRIDDSKEEISLHLQAYHWHYLQTKDLAQDIINIIKNKIGE